MRPYRGYRLLVLRRKDHQMVKAKPRSPKRLVLGVINRHERLALTHRIRRIIEKELKCRSAT